MKFIRVAREKRFALALNDPQPISGSAESWTRITQFATVGIFVLLLGAVLLYTRALLLPIFAAAIIATTLSPLVNSAERAGLPASLTALLLVCFIFATTAFGITLLADPIGEWIARAPEIGAMLKQKLYILDRPLGALRELQNTIMPRDVNAVTVNTGMTELVAPVIGFLTPAASQILLFFITLIFFLIGHTQLRSTLVSLMPSRDAKLRMLRIDNDIRQNLTGYVAVLTVINIALGAVTAALTWAIGFPTPIILGLLTAILNYIPYIGPGIMAFVLFAVGLVSFPTLTHALIAPAAFVAITTIEGHIVTPTILGRRLTLSPLMVVLNLAFWTWLWGPAGAFLAVPLSIVLLVTIHHLLPDDDPKLPS